MKTTDINAGRLATRALQDAGLSVTVPRLAVLTVLFQIDKPLPAIEIQRLLIAKEVGIRLSSTYAALKRLVTVGLVVNQEFGGGRAFFCIASNAAQHCVHCVETGAKHWFPDNALQTHIAQFCQAHGFELQDYTLSISARPVQAN